MINSLHIDNYQSHKKTELEFSDGINIICGDSDSGKSAILRALNWVVFNKPAGDAFKSWWTDETTVKLESNNKLHTRIKSDKENSYSESKKVYKAFGQGVPEEIEQALNLSSINFQSQHNPHFLLSQSAGEVSRYLNGIVNLDVIDTALSNANRKIKSNNAELLNQEQLANQYQTELESYSWIEEKEKEIEKLEGIDKEAQYTAQRKHLLLNYADEIQKTKDSIYECIEKTKHEKQINALLEISKTIQSIESKADVIDSILDNIDSANSNLKQAKIKLKDEKQIESVLKLSEKINAVYQKEGLLKNSVIDIEEMKNRILEAKQKIKSKEKDFKKAFPRSCPLCGK